MKIFIAKEKNNKLDKIMSITMLITTLVLAVLCLVEVTRNFLLGAFGYLIYAYLICLLCVGLVSFFGKKVNMSKRNKVMIILTLISFMSLLHVAFLRAEIESVDNYIVITYINQSSVGGAVFSALTYWLLAIYRNYAFMLSLSIVVFGFILLAATFPLIKKLDAFVEKKKSHLKTDKNTDNKENIKTNPIPPKAPIKEEQPIFSDEIIAPVKQDANSLLFGDTTPTTGVEKRPLFSTLIEDDKERERISAELLFSDSYKQKKEESSENYAILDKGWNSDDLNRLYTNQGRLQLLRDNQNIGNRSAEEVFGPYTPDGEYPFDEKNMEKYADNKPEQSTIKESQSGNILVSEPKAIENKSEFDDRAALEELKKPLTFEESSYYKGTSSENQTASKKSFSQTETIDSKTSVDKPGVVTKQEPYISQIAMDPSILKGSRPKYESETMKKTKVALPETDNVKVNFGEQTSLFDKQNTSTSKPEKPVMSKPYNAPPLSLLKDHQETGSTIPENYEEFKTKIEATMEEFEVPAEVVGARRGPTFTLYELKLGPGYQISKIRNLKENLVMRLEVKQIRILAPIEGKDAFGLEIPNKSRDIVGLKSILTSSKFKNTKDSVSIAFGKTLYGEPFVGDLAKMPHLLVAGATGTGKSVFLNSVIVSMLYKYSPEDLRLVLIDPKRVEMSIYRGLPNLLLEDTVKESAQAVNVLKWLTEEMDRRYKVFENVGCQNIDQYNEMFKPSTEPKMARIVLIIDEMADLMLTGKGRVEDYVVRIAQLARACGIHMIIATQRPIVKVITGLIKSNILCRVAFAVKTSTDSRVILDEMGAEDLLGKGDMIFSTNEGMTRMQGALVELSEIKQVCDYIRNNNTTDFDETIVESIKVKVEPTIDPEEAAQIARDNKEAEEEELLGRIIKYFISKEKASISSAQSKFGIGYQRAKKAVDELEERGYIGPETTGAQGREILITALEAEELFPSVD